MYLHCHNCDWSQDDFWDKGYNPLKSMMYWEEALLEKPNMLFPGELDTKGMTYAQVIAKEMQRSAQQILAMEWHTLDEFNKVKEKGGIQQCPKCGSSDHFDMD